MSYIYKVLEDAPIGLWPLDGLSGGVYPDQSGYGNDASVGRGGSMSSDKPITALGIAGQLITAGSLSIPNTSIMFGPTAGRSFTLEFWFRHKTATGSGTMFQRNASGVTVSGNTITATVQLTNTINASYSELKVGENYHVVVVYDSEHLMLWINNVLVDSAIISATDSQTIWPDTSTTLNFSVSGGYSMIIDSLALYNYALRNTQINDHYTYGTDYPDVSLISTYNGARPYRFCDATTPIYSVLSVPDWSVGTLGIGAAVSGSSLVNSYTNGSYPQTTWIARIPIAPDSTHIVPGSRLTWMTPSTGITVEFSKDAGTTWTAVTNGSDPLGRYDLSNGVDLAIRVTLPSGSSQSVVDSLKFVIFNTESSVVASVPITATSYLGLRIAETDYAPSSFNDNLGITLPGSGSTLLISPDSGLGGYQALEMLVRITTATTNATILDSNNPSGHPTITANASGQWVFSEQAYVDGVSVSAGTPVTITTGTWHHIITTMPTHLYDLFVGNNAAETASYPMQIGYLALYYQAITAAQVTAIYNGWVGTLNSRVVDSSIVTVKEHILDSGLPCRAYSFDWSVSAAG